MLRTVPSNGDGVRLGLRSDPVLLAVSITGIGSLRRVAESLGAIEGDYLFVIPNDGRLEFDLSAGDELTAADPSTRLLLRLGPDRRSVILAVRHAHRRSVFLPTRELDEVEELLEVRGDRDVLRLFDSRSST